MRSNELGTLVHELILAEAKLQVLLSLHDSQPSVRYGLDRVEKKIEGLVESLNRISQTPRSYPLSER